MWSRLGRQLLWTALGASIILFYVTFLTARTYYNPSVTLIIIVLGAFIAVGGIVLSRLPRGDAGRVMSAPLLESVRGLFAPLLALALAVISADVFLTLYAVAHFGVSVEANRAVAALIRRGEVATWLGQQYTPTLLAGAVFGLARNVYARTILTFFVMGLLVYASTTVMHDAYVVYQLSWPGRV